MKITELNLQCQYYPSINPINEKNSGDTEMFKNEVASWEEQFQEKTQKDLENDRGNTIEMSEKNWNNFINRVDNAISTLNDNEKMQEKEIQLPEKKIQSAC